MSRLVCLLVVLFVFCTLALARGHPPGEIEVEFDIEEHVLRVKAQHVVSDSSKHYVDRIVVELNGEKMIEQKFRSQVDSKAQLVEYRFIDARPGDGMVVTAGCNIAGRKKAEILVEEQLEQQEESPMREE